MHTCSSFLSSLRHLAKRLVGGIRPHQVLNKGPRQVEFLAFMMSGDFVKHLVSGMKLYTHGVKNVYKIKFFVPSKCSCGIKINFSLLRI